LTDSLSNLMAQEKIYTRGNSKVAELKDLLAEERTNLKILWIPAHVGIGGKDALEQEVVNLDYCRWVKEEFKRKRQNDWGNSGKTMVVTKSEVDRYRNTEGIPLRHQVIISRLRMGYTNLTHGYRINDGTRPLCTDYNQGITVEHILWQCPNYDIQRSRSNISREALGNTKEEAKRVIKYLKEIGLALYLDSKYRRQRPTHHGEPRKMEDLQG
jgi:hypothetical protein